MPDRHGITVSVTDLKGKPFTEYGVQNLSNSGRKSKVCSTKIEAKTGVAFNILIKTQTPFPWDENEYGTLGSIQSILTHDYNLRNSCKNNVFNNQPVLSKPVEEDAERSRCASEPPPAPSSTSAEAVTKPPPYSLAVCVYIDGNRTPECRSILWLDPNDQVRKYKPDGLRLTGRWETDKDRHENGADRHSIHVKSWVWNAYGSLDQMIKSLDVNAADPKIPTSAEQILEEELLEGIKNAGMQEEVMPKAGVIRVIIKRIVITGEVKKTTKPDLYAGDRDECDKNMGEIGKHVDHLTGVQKGKGQAINLHVMKWASYKFNENFYVDFQFQYMGRPKLVNLGLSQPDGTPTLFGRIQDPEDGKKSKQTKKRTVDEDTDDDTTPVGASKASKRNPTTRAQTRKTVPSTKEEYRSASDADAEDESDDEEEELLAPSRAVISTHQVRKPLQ